MTLFPLLLAQEKEDEDVVNFKPILSQNVMNWEAEIELKAIGDFVPTKGLKVSGEIGWHQHGSSDKVDVDIDLAIIISAEETIDYTTMVMWAMPVLSQETPGSLEYEVGLFEYQRGRFIEPNKWNLIQSVCQGYKGGDYLYNPNGE